MRDEPGLGEDKVLEWVVTWPPHVTCRHAPAACFPVTWPDHEVAPREPATYSRCSPYHRELSSSTTWYTFLVCFFRNFRHEWTLLLGKHAASSHGRGHAYRVSRGKSRAHTGHHTQFSLMEGPMWHKFNENTVPWAPLGSMFICPKLDVNIKLSTHTEHSNIVVMQIGNY